MNMARIDLRGAELSAARLRSALPRGGVDVDAVVPKVRPIVDAVAARGAEAALEFGESFDGVRPAQVRVPAADLQSALDRLRSDVRTALEVAIERTRAVHADQRRTDTTTTLGARRHGHRTLGAGRAGRPLRARRQRRLPVQRGDERRARPDRGRGLAGHREPAAGAVRRPAASRPSWPPHACSASTRCGPSAAPRRVALLAYGGTDTDGAELAPVDMVTGPGNIYVTAAKRICRSQIGIDAEAGPTEIAILADHTADPVHVAADLISQAEHDEMAASVLVTASIELADATDRELAIQLQTTVHRERVTAALTGRQSAIVLVDDIDAGVKTVNAYAAEHLEIQTVDAREVAARIRSAGAIFVGACSPVSLGDYCAGSNHVLPTAGCARHSSGLSVQTFLRGIHVVDYDEAALKDVSGYVITLAEAENLPAHGEAVRRRFET